MGTREKIIPIEVEDRVISGQYWHAEKKSLTKVDPWQALSHRSQWTFDRLVKRLSDWEYTPVNLFSEPP